MDPYAGDGHGVGDHVVPIRAVSRRALALLREGRDRLHVLSVHAQACNFLSEDGALIALVSPRLGRGPFHLVLSEEADFHRLCAFAPVLWVRGNVLELGGRRFSLDRAQVWDPRVTWPRLSSFVHLLKERTRAALAQKKAQGALFHLIRRRIDEGLEWLLGGLVTGEEARTRAGVTRLAGLGPGLTPAGDDVLLGVLAALWALRRMDVLDLLAPLVRSFALPHTTQLSASWLHYALEGAFSEPWHALAAAWDREDAAEVSRVLESIRAIGATSGYYALLGFLHGLERFSPGDGGEESG